MEMEISPEEVKKALGSDGMRLIDVRGEDEWNFARIQGATLITQELMEEMVSSWDRETPIVFYCHSGVRSLHAVHFFRQKGFENVKSMAGGITAWSLSVDPSIPRY